MVNGQMKTVRQATNEYDAPTVNVAGVYIRSRRNGVRLKRSARSMVMRLRPTRNEYDAPPLMLQVSISGVVGTVLVWQGMRGQWLNGNRKARNERVQRPSLMYKGR